MIIFAIAHAAIFFLCNPVTAFDTNDGLVRIIDNYTYPYQLPLICRFPPQTTPRDT